MVDYLAPTPDAEQNQTKPQAAQQARMQALSAKIDPYYSVSPEAALDAFGLGKFSADGKPPRIEVVDDKALAAIAPGAAGALSRLPHPPGSPGSTGVTAVIDQSVLDFYNYLLSKNAPQNPVGGRGGLPPQLSREGLNQFVSALAGKPVDNILYAPFDYPSLASPLVSNASKFFFTGGQQGSHVANLALVGWTLNSSFDGLTVDGAVTIGSNPGAVTDQQDGSGPVEGLSFQGLTIGSPSSYGEGVGLYIYANINKCNFSGATIYSAAQFPHQVSNTNFSGAKFLQPGAVLDYYTAFSGCDFTDAEETRSPEASPGGGSYDECIFIGGKMPNATPTNSVVLGAGWAAEGNGNITSISGPGGLTESLNAAAGPPADGRTLMLAKAAERILQSSPAQLLQLQNAAAAIGQNLDVSPKALADLQAARDACYARYPASLKTDALDGLSSTPSAPPPGPIVQVSTPAVSKN